MKELANFKADVQGFKDDICKLQNEKENMKQQIDELNTEKKIMAKRH